MKAKSLIFPLFVVATLLVGNVYASVDLTEFDDRLGEALGVGAFGGGLILSFVILFFFLGMLGIITKRKPSTFMVVFLSFAILSACIAFGWFPVWSLIFLVLLLAFMFGDKIIKSVR